LHRAKKDLDAAADAFARALQIKPDDATTMYWLATNLMDQGKLSDAEAMLDRTQEADPKEVRIWYRRGQIQMQRAEYERAIKSFERAKSLGVDAKMVRQKIQECREALARQ
jgi:tetratricopeptide (TPR) repeat protein